MPRIRKSVVDAMIVHARKDAPIEACGYLAGKAGMITEAIPLTNMDASPEHFSLDPAEQFAAVRRMRTVGLNLEGVYHSHPATPARPSHEDVRMANDPALSYVIVSVATSDAVVQSFRIRDTTVEEEELIIE